MTFETFDQSDNGKWPDQKEDNDKDKDKYKDNDKDKYIKRAILVTCDIWDTDYIPDNWEPEFMTINTWQLRVTRDSIRNSCDVFLWRIEQGLGVHFMISENSIIQCNGLVTSQYEILLKGQIVHLVKLVWGLCNTEFTFSFSVLLFPNPNIELHLYYDTHSPAGRILYC